MKSKAWLYVALMLVGLPLASAGGASQKSYFWEYNSKRYQLTYSFNQDDYKAYKDMKRDYTNFAVYTEELPAHPVIDEFALRLKQLAKKQQLTDKQTIELIASFVQHLKYRDDGKYEYPRYPIETLVEQGGDCEDTAILLASILRSLGYKSVLLSPTGHMGVGVAVKGEWVGTGIEYAGDKYYYIETTSKGWGIGDYPDHLSQQIKVYDPGYLAGGKALTLTARGVEPSSKEKTTQGQVDSTPKKSIQDFEFQDGYIHRKEVLVSGPDVVVVNGQKETCTPITGGKKLASR